MRRKSLSFKRLIKSFGYAFNGIRVFVRQEQNARIHLIAFCCAVVAGFFFRLAPSEWTTVILVGGSVLTAEAINSSIEELSDAVSPERNPKIKLVKDLAAGAVLLAAITAAIVGAIIFLPKVIALC
ncbi:MAG: diacylglycerol kinase family protein [Tannerella sp.]|jgi:diacylglycerol kinase (ATP)|nr:diacylglycerol kinase family protein [Tannerella sp.]